MKSTENNHHRQQPLPNFLRIPMRADATLDATFSLCELLKAIQKFFLLCMREIRHAAQA